MSNLFHLVRAVDSPSPPESLVVRLSSNWYLIAGLGANNSSPVAWNRSMRLLGIRVKPCDSLGSEYGRISTYNKIQVRTRD